MRLLAGLATAFAFGAATAGAAQSLGYDSGLRLDDRAAFAPDRGPHTQKDDFTNLIEREQFTSDGASINWRTDSVTLGKTAGGSVDSLRLSLGGAMRGDSGLPARLDPRGARFEADAYEIAVTRDWAPVRFGAGDLDVNLTPHTGIGVSNSGGQAEAGATLTVAQKRDDEIEGRLNDLGVRDGKSYGNRGRWYLFAAASGRAVGLNVLRNGSGWDRDGWSTDAASGLVGDAHVGIAWRKGPMQTSFGYIHREVKGEHMVYGQDTKQDSVVAFSFSIKPEN